MKTFNVTIFGKNCEIICKSILTCKTIKELCYIIKGIYEEDKNYGYTFCEHNKNEKYKITNTFNIIKL